MRIALPFLATTTVILLFLALLLGNAARTIYTDRLEQELQSQAAILADDAGRAMTENGGVVAVQESVDSLAPLIPSRLTIIDADGSVIADSEGDPATMENHSDRPEVIAARNSGVGEAQRSSSSVDDDFLYVAVPIQQIPGAVARVAVSLHDVDVVVTRIQRWIAAAAGAAIFISIGLSWLVTGRLVRPLSMLRDQTMAVAAGDLGARVMLDSTQEIRDLGTAFNAMTSELQYSVQTIERTGIRLEAVLAGLADGVILTDDQGTVIRLNRAATEMLEVSDEQAVGRPYMQAVRDHELARQLREAFQGRPPESVTVEYGLKRLQLLSNVRIIEGAGERLGLVVLRDVTLLRQLEQVRREFVANVSHELRTPLTSIRALAETLEAGAIDERELAEDFIARILGEVDRLTALVEDLLDMARLEAGRSPLQLVEISPEDLIRKGADRLRPQVERARLSLDVEFGEGLVPIQVDRTRIEQVLLNLVHNAIKFTPPGGAITIRVERDGRFITTTVRDTGVGISETDQARLFERFYKSDKARHSEGTGLGLAITKHIVQLHGGQISVESVLGEGSAFRFSLPIRPVASAKAAKVVPII